MDLDAYAWAIIALAFLTSFAIGANDAANALATSYGSNALRLTYLVVLGGIFEFIGAYYCSSHVAGTLVDSIVDGVDTVDYKVVEKMMLGTCISSFLFIICSSVFGMPISGTHTVVGALIGCGMATLGSANIKWSKLSVIVSSWFVAPAVAAVISALIMWAVSAATLNPKKRLESRFLWLTLIAASSCSVIAKMMIEVTKETEEAFTAKHWIILAFAFVAGLVISRLALLALTIGRESLSLGLIMSCILQVWSTKRFE